MNISIIGAGNVAVHLGAALQHAGHRIIQVYSRTADHANVLALKLNAQAISNLIDLDKNAEFYIIALKDDAIAEIAGLLRLPGKIVVHTSGSVSMQSLETVSERLGVFYPLQTFSKQRDIDFKNIPIFLEASDESVYEILESLAESISGQVFEADSGRRKILHIAAVFASNFSNHMYHLAEDYLSKYNLPFDILKPLILETSMKAVENRPSEVQTGPAVRRDQSILEEHLHMLSEDPDLAHLYKEISKSIQAKKA